MTFPQAAGPPRRGSEDTPPAPNWSVPPAAPSTSRSSSSAPTCLHAPQGGYAAERQPPHSHPRIYERGRGLSEQPPDQRKDEIRHHALNTGQNLCEVGSRGQDVSQNTADIADLSSTLATNYLNINNDVIVKIEKPLFIETYDDNEAILTLKSNKGITSGSETDEAGMLYIVFVGDTNPTYGGGNIDPIARIQIQKEWIRQNPGFDQYRNSTAFNFLCFDKDE